MAAYRSFREETSRTGPTYYAGLELRGQLAYRIEFDAEKGILRVARLFRITPQHRAAANH
ncbi:MAG TPA: hypothetical protein VNH18_34135 [Bryobacteraceae bacterium]|nr:hypothetical protein [Bryobacteraceae bacterium]